MRNQRRTSCSVSTPSYYDLERDEADWASHDAAVKTDEKSLQEPVVVQTSISSMPLVTSETCRLQRPQASAVIDGEISVSV